VPHRPLSDRGCHELQMAAKGPRSDRQGDPGGPIHSDHAVRVGAHDPGLRGGSPSQVHANQIVIINGMTTGRTAHEVFINRWRGAPQGGPRAE
jgi:hypothetical protein